MAYRKMMLLALMGLVLFGGVGGVLAQTSPATVTPLFVAALGQTKKTWSIVMLDPAADGPQYLTDDRYDEIAPLVSADGRYIVFLRGDFSTNDPLQYYVLDRNCLPKCQPKALPDEVNQMTDLRWSPVGAQLVAWGLDNAVWLIDVENDTVDQVITGTWFAKPSWSPDGSLIVVSSDEVPPNGRLSDDIQLIPATKDADSRDLVNLTYSGAYVEETQPLYSPDSHWIAYITKNLSDDPTDAFHDNPFALLMMDTACIDKPTTCPDTRQLLSKDGHMVTNFAWSPDSRYIAYIDGNPINTDDRYGNLWVVDVRSGKTRQLTDGKTTGGITWSPDSSAVAFERVTDSSYDVYIAFISSKHDPGPALDGFRASANPYWAYQ